MLKIKYIYQMSRLYYVLFRLNKASLKARYRCEHLHNKMQFRLFDFVIKQSGIDRKTLWHLVKTLDISSYEICIYWMHVGSFPTPGHAIGIKHMGIDLVIQCIEENKRIENV